MIIDSLIELRGERFDPLHPRDPALAQLFGGGFESSSGIVVTEASAVTFSAVYAAVAFYAETMGSLPLFVFKDDDQGNHVKAPEHPSFDALHSRPNPLMSAMTFRSTMTMHLALQGNAYAEIVRDGRGNAREYWPLAPSRVTPKVEGGTLFYEVRYDDGTRIMSPSQILHHKDLGGDGITGWSRIRLARESIGAGLAAEQYGATFFGNNGVPGIILKHPGNPSDKAIENIRNSWTGKHKGPSKAHRIAVLREGMDITTVGIPPDDAQFIATREFSIVDVARWYRLPPHVLQSLQKANFSNVEHLEISLVVYSVRPWAVRMEQEYNRQAFPPGDTSHFTEHILDGLLRGDTETRFKAYATGRQWGWLSANDVRRLENMTSLGERGDIYMTPLNMVPAGEEGMTDANAAQNRAEARAPEMEPLLVDVVGRILHKEIGSVRRLIVKHKDDQQACDEAVRDFYHKHEAYVVQIVGPFCRALGVVDRAAPYASRFVERGRSEILAQVRSGSPNLMGLLESWPIDRASDEVMRLRSIADEDEKQLAECA